MLTVHGSGRAVAKPELVVGDAATAESAIDRVSSSLSCRKQTASRSVSKRMGCKQTWTLNVINLRRSECSW